MWFLIIDEVMIMVGVGILLGVIVIVGIFLIATYNGLVSRRNRIKEALVAIDVYLQNRYDALTQIAEVVVSYATHERETLAQVTNMRVGLRNQPPSADKIKQYEEVDRALSSINFQAEAYPEIKANENYIHLQRTINELEEKLSASRRSYNSNVAGYNTAIQSIPTNMVASMFGFREESLLEIAQDKKAEVDLRNILGR